MVRNFSFVRFSFDKIPEADTPSGISSISIAGKLNGVFVAQEEKTKKIINNRAVPLNRIIKIIFVYYTKKVCFLQNGGEKIYGT